MLITSNASNPSLYRTNMLIIYPNYNSLLIDFLFVGRGVSS